jgi:hypothetical protein
LVMGKMTKAPTVPTFKAWSIIFRHKPSPKGCK